jgi:3'-phosphoadenosine 5'-phosphosulfate sulfotransferase (PAPS reductase)/FAD synthetase
MRNNIVSVSGGKDSTALLLLAIERNTENLQAVFADTGHEHPTTIGYIEYLNAEVFPIKTIKADFSERIMKKRKRLELIAAGEPDPVNRKMKYPWTPESAERALKVLHPTGNPFLDLCLLNGLFPSTRTRWCSKELKRDLMITQVNFPLMEQGHEVYSWQGVRRDESLARRDLSELDEVGGGLWNYRPILDWTAEDCFAMHKKHGVKHNPLYELGMSRVGCMPCIHATKNEILEISKRFPEELERVKEWERLVAEASPLSAATFFPVTRIEKDIKSHEIDTEKHGIDSQVAWAKTGRGGKDIDMFKAEEEPALCSSIYGLCE